MQAQLSHCSFKNTQQGQAILLTLIVTVVGSLLIVTLSRVILWKFDRVFVFSNQRHFLETWEEQKVVLVEDALSASALSKLNSSVPFATIKIPRNYALRATLSVPLFKVSKNETLLFRWRKLIANNPGGCLAFIGAKCSSIDLSRGIVFFAGDLQMEKLSLPPGKFVIAITGTTALSDLWLSKGTSLEIISGRTVSISSWHQGDSQLLIHSALGETKLPELPSDSNCSSLVVSESPRQIPARKIVPDKCLPSTRSAFWQRVRFLGEADRQKLRY